MTLRTLLKLLLAPLVLVGGLMFVSPSAHAQSQAYCTPDYDGSLTFTADPTVLQPGDAVNLGGTGWPPDALVPLSFNNQFIGNAETDGSGSFTFPYVIPAETPAGPFEFAATCCEVDTDAEVQAALPKATFASFGQGESAQGAAPSCPGETVTLTQTVQIITAATTTVTVTPLPVTGSDSASLVQIGIVLIVVGGLVALLAARRRRTTVSA